MSRAHIDEDFVPVNAPLHGSQAEAAARQEQIASDTERMFAEQDARMERRIAANAARQKIADAVRQMNEALA